MSTLTYVYLMAKPLVVFTEIKSPPMSKKVQREAGYLLRMLQEGEKIGMPHSRSMTTIGRRCHELRISDSEETWRIVYHIAATEIVVLHAFKKKTQKTSQATINLCKERLKAYRATD